MEENVLNGKIVGTFLGNEDHGIPTCLVDIETSSGTQGFGGHDLRYYGVEYILRLLSTVGVDSWEKLHGTPVRVERVKGLLKGIGHYYQEKWFRPEQDLAKGKTA